MIYLTDLRKDLPDERDYVFSAATDYLPRAANLLAWTDEIEDQGSTGSCTANAGSSACEIWTSRAKAKKDFSRTFLYWCVRDYSAQFRGVDNGAYMRDICKALAEHGICEEQDWPWSNGVYSKPSPAAYAAAKAHRVGRYERIMSGQYRQIKAAIAKGYPVLVGMVLREPFYGVRGPLDSHSGIFHLSDYRNKPIIGQHAMTIVGYDDDKGYWLIENSWGPGWGDKGIVAFPYGLYDMHALDQWVFTEFANLDLPEIWQEPGIFLAEHDSDTIKARIVPKPHEVGQAVNVWIALVKDGAVYLKKQDGTWDWQSNEWWHADRLTLQASNPITLADGVDLAPFAPFDAYVAYGQTPFDWTVGKVASI